MIYAGKLNQRIRLQRPKTIRNDIGEKFIFWEQVAEVWADVRYQSGISHQKHAADLTRANVSIQIRLPPDFVVEPDFRVILLSNPIRWFSVQAVLPDANFREYLNLSCYEVPQNQQDGR